MILFWYSQRVSDLKFKSCKKKNLIRFYIPIDKKKQRKNSLMQMNTTKTRRIQKNWSHNYSDWLLWVPETQCIPMIPRPRRAPSMVSKVFMSWCSEATEAWSCNKRQQDMWGEQNEEIRPNIVHSSMKRHPFCCPRTPLKDKTRRFHSGGAT